MGLTYESSFLTAIRCWLLDIHVEIAWPRIKAHRVSDVSQTGWIAGQHIANLVRSLARRTRSLRYTVRAGSQLLII